MHQQALDASINATAAALAALQQQAQQAVASAENVVVPQSVQTTLVSLQVRMDVYCLVSLRVSVESNALCWPFIILIQPP